VTAAADREVKLWKLDGTDLQDVTRHNLGQHTGQIDLPEILAVSFGQDNKTILLGGGNSQENYGVLELCDSETMSCRTIAKYNCPVRTVSFSPNGQFFALGKVDGSVEFWKKVDDGFRPVGNLKGHQYAVMALCFSPDGKFLATGSADTTVNLWQIDNIWDDAATKTVTLKNCFPVHTDVVSAIRFSPNSQLIATASYDKTVKLWHLDGTLYKTLHGHNDRVVALDFSPEGQILASASNDKTAILWNLSLELGLDQLISYGFSWISGYLRNNPSVSQEDRKLLQAKEFPTLKYESQKLYEA
ncbi:MAG: WD40 repeat domain-containing protein, partial [Scytonema sp. PMC 1069.18]|nr:WD40 repeat domain-containing protein [Scytonema sp. PMC 1069.18]